MLKLHLAMLLPFLSLFQWTIEGEPIESEYTADSTILTADNAVNTADQT